MPGTAFVPRLANRSRAQFVRLMRSSSKRAKRNDPDQYSVMVFNV